MKLIVVGSLWFISFWCMYELFVSAMGAPRMVGPLLGVIGSLVGLIVASRSRGPEAVATPVEARTLGPSVATH